MAYAFNDDKSKNDLSDIVRTSDITDVIRSTNSVVYDSDNGFLASQIGRIQDGPNAGQPAATGTTRILSWSIVYNQNPSTFRIYGSQDIPNLGKGYIFPKDGIWYMTYPSSIDSRWSMFGGLPEIYIPTANGWNNIIPHPDLSVVDSELASAIPVKKGMALYIDCTLRVSTSMSLEDMVNKANGWTFRYIPWNYV